MGRDEGRDFRLQIGGGTVYAALLLLRISSANHRSTWLIQLANVG